MLTISRIWNRLYEQGVAVWLCITAWVIYFFVTPYVWSLDRVIGTLFIMLPGIFVSNLLIYFQHETWHQYFVTPHNRTLFVLLCTILFVQPHLYDLGHRTHHAKVNTHGDLELYPIGRIHNRLLRATLNCLSIVFGSLFLLALGGGQESGLTRKQAVLRFLLTYSGAALLWGGITWASMAVFPVSGTDVLVSYLLTIWAVSVFHHHNELIEHGNLIVEGDFKFRSAQTRNLSAETLAARVFLFMAHQDSREHTLHHTDPSSYSRPFTGRYPMPAGAVYLTFRQYAAILWSMMLGREQVIRQHEKVVLAGNT